MPRIRVMTDSASDLPIPLTDRLGIDVVSLTIRFGHEEFVDRVELAPAEFWRRCHEAPVLPETAAPAPGAFSAAYEQAAAAGYDGVIVATLSGALSATYQSAMVAAETVAGRIDVRVVDTRAVTMAQGLVVMELAELAQAGQMTLDEMEAHARALVPRAGICGTLATLEHLVKGGRVGGARALLGQMLAIKPLLELRDGVVAERGRQRTRARALAAVADEARRHAPLSRLAIVHGMAPDAPDLEALLASTELEHPLVVADIGPVVGTHSGPGILGACWLERARDTATFVS